MSVCSFCDQSANVNVVTPRIGVCDACVTQIARVLRDQSAVDDVWTFADPPARTAAAVRASPMRSNETASVDEVFEAFKQGVMQTISLDDVETHTNLAMAYIEMGLLIDALREVLIAVAAPRSATTTTALKLLLTPPLLTPSGLERLGARLKAYARYS